MNQLPDERVAQAREQAAFAAALFDPTLDPPGLKTWNGSDPVQRFGVYRNNVIVALIDALADTFPAVQTMVGGSNFRILARASLEEDLPDTPVLAEFGRRFPDFISRYAPTAQVPGLADLARLEYARVEAFHATDAEALTAEELAPLLAEASRLPRLRLGLHPSLRLVSSPQPIVDLWAAQVSGGDPAELRPDQAQTGLVLRHDLEVEIYALPADDAAFVAALLAGQTLGEAVRNCGNADFDCSAVLALLLRARAVCHAKFDLEETP